MLASLVGPRVVSAHRLGCTMLGLACEQRLVWPARSISFLQQLFNSQHSGSPRPRTPCHSPALEGSSLFNFAAQAHVEIEALYFLLKRVTFSYCASRGERKTIALLYRLSGGADDRG